ncbi:MAG: hypothetical protein EOP10_05370 [Proteobacteria bacterium]|nr:MAG: hypothetical protein EOP10_05370 [Pseudomonadota bacterium]
MKRILSLSALAFLMSPLAVLSCTGSVTDECKDDDKSLVSNCTQSENRTSFTIGGTISGAFTQTVLQNNSGDDLTITAAGTFTFPTPLAEGATYSVSVKSLALIQNECIVSNGTGTVQAANVTNITISCGPIFTLSYDGNGSTGGTVPASQIGAEGSILTLHDNSGGLVKSGYEFDGWNSVADGSGNAYAAAAPFTLGASDSKLYANWLAGIGAAPDRPAKTLGTFTQNPTGLPVGHQNAAAVQIGSKMYLVGGSIAATPDPVAALGITAGTTDAILESTIAADGTPGTFTKSQYKLAVPRRAATMAIVGKYAYIFGGFSDNAVSSNTPLTSIERATVGANGLTSDFTVVGSTMASGRYNLVSLVTSAYVYLIGGGVTSGLYYSNTIQRATVDKITGDIGNFTLLTRNVVSATEIENGIVDTRSTHGAIRLGNNYFIVGGEGSSGGLASIEKAVIGADGTLGNFVKQSYALNRTRNRISIVALRDKAYVFGGWSGGFLAQIEEATITNDDLSQFSDMVGNSLPQPCENGTPLLTSKGAFLFGGQNGGTTYSTIQSGPLF